MKEVQRLREELVEQYPEDKELLVELATTIWYIGRKTEDTSLIRDAIAKLDEADLPAYRDHLASYLHELGWRLMSRGQHAKAAEELQESVEIFQELANEFPHIPRYDFLAAAYTSDLAKSLANSGQESTAEQLAMDVSVLTGSDFVLRGNIYKEIHIHIHIYTYTQYTHIHNLHTHIT